MQYLLGLIGALVGAVIYNFVKRKSAESLLVNTKTKEELTFLDGDINKLKADLHLEAEKRKLLDEQTKNSKDSNESLENLKDFFNKPSDK